MVSKVSFRGRTHYLVEEQHLLFTPTVWKKGGQRWAVYQRLVVKRRKGVGMSQIPKELAGKIIIYRENGIWSRHELQVAQKRYDEYDRAKRQKVGGKKRRKE